MVVHGRARSSAMHILLKKLTALHDISANEKTALLATLTPPRTVMRGHDIVAEGSAPKHITVLLSGTACRYTVLSKVKRHIFAFQYPGDVMKLVDHGIGALSDCEVAHIPHEKIAALCTKYPNLAYAFWRDSMIDTSILHRWALGGSRKTVERIANLFCEIFVRLEAVGLAEIGRPLNFDATQRDLADALALSLVRTEHDRANGQDHARHVRQSSTGAPPGLLVWEKAPRRHLEPISATGQFRDRTGLCNIFDCARYLTYEYPFVCHH
jgi:CRP-like cAMP-binding protein